MTDIRSAQPTHTIQYGERRLSFLWRVRERGAATGHRKARIHVYPNGLIEVETPADASLEEAKQALLKRAQWVSRHLLEIETRRAEVLDREYVSGEAVFYLGRRYTLKVIQTSDSPSVKMIRGKVCVSLSRAPDRRAVKTALDHWYRNRAKDVYGRRLAAITGQLPWLSGAPNWSIREMKTQWGSCSPSGRLTFNPHLIKTSTRCIDYVILHELCHLKEHNHSARFYALLSRAMPDWEFVKARLDELSELYLNN